MGQFTQVENPISSQIVLTRERVINFGNHERVSVRLTHSLFGTETQKQP